MLLTLPLFFHVVFLRMQQALEENSVSAAHYNNPSYIHRLSWTTSHTYTYVVIHISSNHKLTMALFKFPVVMQSMKVHSNFSLLAV